jgi:hypothetical protein
MERIRGENSSIFTYKGICINVRMWEKEEGKWKANYFEMEEKEYEMEENEAEKEIKEETKKKIKGMEEEIRKEVEMEEWEQNNIYGKTILIKKMRGNVEGIIKREKGYFTGGRKGKRKRIFLNFEDAREYAEREMIKKYVFEKGRKVKKWMIEEKVGNKEKEENELWNENKGSIE